MSDTGSNKEKKVLDRIISFADGFVGICTIVLISGLLIFSLYALWDMLYSDKTAFSSWDLLQYRPNVEDGSQPSFEELRAINPDVVGWITVYGTSIDYPVLQGKDDLEYLSRDVYGDFKLTGSIFLSSENADDFSDPYSMIYGHHMDNGAMFGGIDKYVSKEYMKSHSEGALITPEAIYRLDIFSSVSTNAYEDAIYDIGAKKQSNGFDNFIKFIDENSIAMLSSVNTSGLDKVVVLSTCDSNSTDGRMVVVAKVSPATEDYLRSHEDAVAEKKVAKGHGEKKPWAVLNLIVLIVSVVMTILFVKEIKNVLCIIPCILGLILFVITENIMRPITVIDKWTPVMLLLLGVIIFTAGKINKLSNKTERRGEANEKTE